MKLQHRIAAMRVRKALGDGGKWVFRDLDITLTGPIPLYLFLKFVISHRSLKVVKV
jgi:hypothetical protein